MSTADDLASVVNDLLDVVDDVGHPDTCDVIRTTQVSDGRGGTTPTETTVGTYRCRLDPTGMRGQEYVSGSVESVEAPYTISMRRGVDVTEQDIIGIGDRRFAIENVITAGAFAVKTAVQAREVS